MKTFYVKIKLFNLLKHLDKKYPDIKNHLLLNKLKSVV